MAKKMISLVRLDDFDMAQRLRQKLEDEGLTPVVVDSNGGDLPVEQSEESPGLFEVKVPTPEASAAVDIVDEILESDWEEEEELPFAGA